jgi:hypothetical protein
MHFLLFSFALNILFDSAANANISLKMRRKKKYGIGE